MAPIVSDFMMSLLIIFSIMFSCNVKADGVMSKKSSQNCIIFNFGDSNTDTGNLCAAFGECPPYGQRLSSVELSPRFSDGKVYLDFLCESLGLSFLRPYLESSGSDFYHGANFAFTGSVIDGVHSAFTLPRQISQFRHFQNRTRLLRARGKGSMISDEEFTEAIYTIDMGQNDLRYALNGSNTYEKIVTRMIPKFLEMVRNAIKELYHLGGRKFWLYNTGPLGCLPKFRLDAWNYTRELDGVRCRLVYNHVANAFNKELSILCETMRSELEDAVIIYNDMYSIKYDLFANTHKYGFENPMEDCISSPTVCPRRVTFDGIHYTEAANGIVACKILSGELSWPNIKLHDLCKK